MAVPKPPSVGLLLPPILLSFVAFVLVLIALLAGTGPQQEALEPYHIIAVNLSNFGHDLAPSSTSSSPKPTETGDKSWLDQLGDGLGDLGQDISDGINNITDEITDNIIEELGISEWYSLHIMTSCEGMFSPNASNPSAWYNTTNCTAQAQGVKLNLTDILDHEIQAGPLNLNINQLPIPSSVQDAIDTVNDALYAIFIFYVLGSTFSGLSFVVSTAVLIMCRKKVTKTIVFANIAISAIAAFVLLIGSAVVTDVNSKGVQKINRAGEGVGISGIRGSKFITISWVAFGLMSLTSSYWTLATLKFTQKWVIVGSRSDRRSEKGLPHYAESTH